MYIYKYLTKSGTCPYFECVLAARGVGLLGLKQHTHVVCSARS